MLQKKKQNNDGMADRISFSKLLVYIIGIIHITIYNIIHRIIVYPVTYVIIIVVSDDGAANFLYNSLSSNKNKTSTAFDLENYYHI